MSAIWESADWTRQFGIGQTGNRQFGMLPTRYKLSNKLCVGIEILRLDSCKAFSSLTFS
jgi:hypothetical protein